MTTTIEKSGDNYLVTLSLDKGILIAVDTRRRRLILKFREPIFLADLAEGLCDVEKAILSTFEEAEEG